MTKTDNGTVTDYRYKDGTDRLISFGTELFAYDDMGNPKTYRNMSCVWEKGRQLKSISDGANTVSFTYDEFGMRTTKTAGGITTNYVYENGKLLREVTGSEKIDFVYGSDGVIGFRTGNKNYLYRKNVFGDVTEIYSDNGTLVGKYSYTAFGECIVKVNEGGIAEKNPIRYRGYYFDEETSLYYLKSRYYDPVTGRFISPDDISYLDPETIGGLNLYAYCLNNPVMNVDPTGHFPILAIILGITALVGMGLTIGGVASNNNTLTAIGLTMVAVPALISGGMAIAAGIGGATYLGIIGGVTAVAGLGSGLFASAEYQEAITGNNWMLDAGMNEGLYNALLLITAAFATIGTISCGVLSSIGNMSSPNAMINSLKNHPSRWKIIKQNISNATGRKFRGGISKYTNYINRWTGSRLGTHEIIRNGIFIHGPHIHPWI